MGRGVCGAFSAHPWPPALEPTAPQAEEIMGQALKELGYPREDLVISTKARAAGGGLR